MSRRPPPLLYESHMHTPMCKHAEGLPREYADVAASRNLKGIIVTCHNPMPDGFSPHVRMDPDELPAYCDLVAESAEASDLPILLGLEADYFPGYEGFLEKQIASRPFNHVLGSVHCQLPEYRKLFDLDDPIEYQKMYYTHLVRAAETRLFDTLAHPDLVKIVTPCDWRPRRIIDHLRRCLDRIAATGTAMELNTSGRYKPGFREFNPGILILQEIHARGIPIVLGADAHSPNRTGDLFLEALHQLDAVGFTHVHHFLDRQRHATPIEDAIASLERNIR